MSGAGNNNTTPIEDDPNSCIPGPLRDFVFDLYQCTRTACNADEQAVLYKETFRDLSSKYFASSAWPATSSISSECGSDPLFLAFYREMTIRHLHSTTRPTVRDRIDGWHVYRTLFDLLLSEAPDAEGTTKKGSVFIISGWVFDILHEFVYQFQGFCQYRTKVVLNAANKASSSTTGSNPSAEILETLSSNRDAWAVETVLFYLHRFLSYATLDVLSADDKRPSLLAYKNLGLFSAVALSRLECLLGDYHQSLVALTPIYETTSNGAIVNEVFQAKLSLAYHAGVSYFMLRRYKDATTILSGICVILQRGFKTGQLRKLSGNEQFMKLQERMIALLAIVTHICPYAKVDDALVRLIRDKHSSQLAKIESGEEGYEDLFIFACPKFVSPAVPNYNITSDNTDETAVLHSSTGQDAYNLQIKQFMTQMSQQRTLRKLRSYLKLYTSIPIDKLASFNDTSIKEFESYLLCYKHKMNQLEHNKDGQDPMDGAVTCAMDLHYFIQDDLIHISDCKDGSVGSNFDEDKDGFRGLIKFEHFYLQQVIANEEIRKEVDALDITF